MSPSRERKGWRMGALSIAFDTIIVGALALPWVVFAADLFFLEDKHDDLRVKVAWAFVTKQVQPAVAGVMLFAMAYLLGSAISRTAQDFFNDDDLIRASLTKGALPTEDNIRTAEYCDQDKEIRDTFKEIALGDFDKLCPATGAETRKRGICSLFGRWCDKYSDAAVRQTQQVFGLQEGALLLKGQDKTERLRQFHNQIMVFRGAAFDGVLASVFCLFGWCARKRVAMRRFFAVPGVFSALGLVSLYFHFQRTGINEAPFMELTLVLLGMAGFVALRKGEQRRWYGVGLFVSLLLLTTVAYLGWWRTEVLYDQQVIYSFYAQSHGLLK